MCLLFILHAFLCVCTCLGVMCVNMCMYTYVCMAVGRGQLQLSSARAGYLVFLRKGFSFGLGLTYVAGSVGHWVPGACLHLPGPEITSIYHHVWMVFQCGIRVRIQVSKALYQLNYLPSPEISIFYLAWSVIIGSFYGSTYFRQRDRQPDPAKVNSLLLIFPFPHDFLIALPAIPDSAPREQRVRAVGSEVTLPPTSAKGIPRCLPFITACRSLWVHQGRLLPQTAALWPPDCSGDIGICEFTAEVMTS